VNLDVSSMVAYVSAVTNGGAMFIFKVTEPLLTKNDISHISPYLTEYLRG